MVGLANQLVTNGDAVYMVVVSAHGPNRKLLDAKVRLFELGKTSSKSALFALARFLRQNSPDILISGLHQANVLALCARIISGNKIPVINTVHSIVSQDFNGTLKTRLLGFFVRRLYAKAQAIVCVSHYAAVELSRFLPKPTAPIQVIYNPVLADNFVSLPGNEFEHEWFKNASPPVVIAVGTLGKVKNFELLIRAFAKVRRSCETRLIILGEGPEHDNLLKLSTLLGVAEDIALPGFVNNVVDYMRRSRVFVLSSKREALPTVLIEALACGLTVIATDCPGGVREILQDGKFGIIVPVDDEDALAAAIENALKTGCTAIPLDALSPYRSANSVNLYKKLFEWVIEAQAAQIR